MKTQTCKRMLVCSAAAIAIGLWAGAAQAALNFNGGAGGVSFGVATYGGAPQAAPVYLLNNFTGLTDILESPGNGFLTADLSIPNNIASWGGALPGGAWQVGGGNGNGAFGTGAVYITGPAVGFALSDANPDGFGAASYEIASWNATYTSVGATAGNYGTYLAVTGHLGSPNAAIALSLRTRITSSVWGAGFDLPELVLAASGSASAYNFQALGGAGGANAVMLINAGPDDFAGLAINNMGAVVIPNLDTFTVTTTLTVIGDPASVDVFFDVVDPGMISLTGTTLPDLPMVSPTELPEPASLSLLAVAGLAILRRRM